MTVLVTDIKKNSLILNKNVQHPP